MTRSVGPLRADQPLAGCHFGPLHLANRDLVKRPRIGASWKVPDHSTFFGLSDDSYRPVN